MTAFGGIIVLICMSLATAWGWHVGTQHLKRRIIGLDQVNRRRRMRYRLGRLLTTAQYAALGFAVGMIPLLFFKA